MKRLVGALVVVWAVPLASFAQGSTENPLRKADIAPTGKFLLSLEYDRITSRDLESSLVTGVETDDTGAFDGTIDPGTVAGGVELESSLILLRLAYSLYAPEGQSFGLEGYLRAGSADIELDGRVTSPGDPTQSFFVDGDFGFAYGAGLRARVFSGAKLSVFVDLGMTSFESDSDIDPVSNLDLDFDAGESIAQDFESSFTEVALSGYAARPFEVGDTTIAVYGGVRFSDLQVEVDGAQDFFDPSFDGRQTIDYEADADDTMVLFVGGEAAFTDHFGAFLEIRGAAESAVALGANFRF